MKPSAKAIAEFVAVFGRTPALPTRVFPWALREKNVLAPARIEADGELIRIDDYEVLRRLEQENAGFLAAHGLEHVNISEIRSKQRPVTQQLARTLYEEGASGVFFGSNETDKICFALFEGRARLAAAGEPVLLTSEPEPLVEAARLIGLVLGPARP